MSTTRGIQPHVLTDRTIARALALTAQMFGLATATVTTIVQVALPLLATMTATHPEVRARLYAASLVTLPEPVVDFYVRMTVSQALRQATMDDFRATYGTMLDSVHRAAARQAGATDGQARDVLAAMLPAITQALGQAHGRGGTAGFVQQLKDVQG